MSLAADSPSITVPSIPAPSVAVEHSAIQHTATQHTAIQHTAIQGTFDELGTPLRAATFVVVDLETTGGSARTCAITEIGAVKVRGGEVLGEFHTLVNPGVAIPPFIAVLTGITDLMVARSPRIEAVLPSFLEFARGAVLVAHNAPFDVGFLRAAAAAQGRTWPGFDVLDTARLARRVLTRDEAPNCKLSTLARLFRTATEPNHRALDDARATVDVLHGLLERLGPLGVQSMEELRTFSSRVSPAQRRKRYLAERLPHAPGVYQFLDPQGRVLYVGKAKDLRTRVRTYFTASEMRARMAEMVTIASDVVPIVCATELEAQVRELRLIAQHKPRYNRRSRFPERASWLKLTVEAFPRLSLVREVRDDGAPYLGPFGSRRAAEAAMEALFDAVPLRQCTLRLSPRKPVAACVLAEMGRCGAPCDGSETVTAYDEHVAAVRAAFHADAGAVVGALTARIQGLAGELRYEDAAAVRDRLAAFLRAAARYQRLAALARCSLLVAARPAVERGEPTRGWEISVVRHGRLVAAGVARPGVPPRPTVDALIAGAETVLPAGPGITAAASSEEMECILHWLSAPGVRLVEVDGEWSSPVRGAGAHHELIAVARGDVAHPFADRRGLRPVHQPAR